MIDCSFAVLLNRPQHVRSFSDHRAPIFTRAHTPLEQYNDTLYTSPFIYHFVLAALAPSTRYYYQCGAASGSSSAVLSFTTAPAVGASTPLVVGVMGDLGQTADSVVTTQHLMSDETIQVCSEGR
jgi:hypothetical protein